MYRGGCPLAYGDAGGRIRLAQRLRLLGYFTAILGYSGADSLRVLSTYMEPPEPTTERSTVKSRPLLVLILLIGSCAAFGYTIYRLLNGMRL